MAFLERDGVRLYYETHGQGPAILLSHGYSATSQMWRQQVEALADAHTVIVWDMRGHGRSAAPEDPALYSEAHTVRDMAALLDTLGFERAVIGGLSLGGYMSLAFHRRHPERVSGLLVIDTGPGYRNASARTAWNQQAVSRAEALERDGFAALAEAATSAERALAVHEDPLGLARAARGMLTQHDAQVIDSLPGIRVPTLVLVGAEDEPFLAATDYMASRIPGARKVILEGAGHAANLDQPEAFNAAVRAFLEDSGL